MILYILTAFSHHFLRVIAVPTVQEPLPSNNVTLAYKDDSTTITTLTFSTIASTLNSNLSKEYTEIADKFIALGCDVPVIPSQVKFWEVNRTHELFFPKKVSIRIYHR